MTKKEQSEREEARETLRQTLKPGATVYTALKHVSRSGMQREISVHAVENGEIVWLTGLVAKACGYRLGKRDGVVVGGCGMDMGFAVVHDLSYALYSQGFGCIGSGCPSNDHSNGDRDYGVHSCDSANAHDDQSFASHFGSCHWHTSGGYALKQRWI